ncbi:entericidin A/B family lipoprotein [Amphibiibacter pelophylacis]|uniref:Entericidin A/B family lipoprotein n=1 Tax=Amphibiibacter pelophylacis TaxID=1799477 RepID=A0ACC6P391_9BURK
MKKIASVLSLCALVLGLSACNTVQGFGKDVQSGGQAAGQAIEKVAK